jgi:hypothetical protein
LEPFASDKFNVDTPIAESWSPKIIFVHDSVKIYLLVLGGAFA